MAKSGPKICWEAASTACGRFQAALADVAVLLLHVHLLLPLAPWLTLCRLLSFLLLLHVFPAGT